MKIPLRRVGNSLGVLIPKTTLDSWGLHEGDSLTLSEQGLRPPAKGGFAHQDLDEHRRAISFAIVRRFTPREIRAQVLANLYRWRDQGVWGEAYREWQEIAEDQDDGRLYSVMLGRDENAVRLRQSSPFVGLLPKDELRKINEETAG